MKIESDIMKTGAVVALLVGVYGGVVFWPGQRQNTALAGEIEDKQSQLQTMAQPDLTPVREDIAALRAELRDRSVDLPVGGLHDRVLHHVSDTLMDRGVTEYETAYGDQEFYKRFAVTPIDVEFDARFTEAFAVLRQIETAGPPLRIEEIKLTGEPDGPTSDVRVTMRLSSFFLPSDSEGGR